MKKKAVTFLLIVFIFVSLGSSYTSPSEETFYATLNGTCPPTDIAGNNYNVLCNNNPTTGVPGVFGDAYSLNGDDLQIESFSHDTTDGFSVSFWMKPDFDSSNQTRQQIWRTKVNGDNNIGIKFRGDNSDQFRFQGSNNNLIIQKDFNQDEWVHVLQVYESDGGAELYWNGTKIFDEMLSSDSNGISDFYIGRSDPTDLNPPTHFYGDFDEFRIIDKEVNSSEVQNLYQNNKLTSSPPATNPNSKAVLFWRLNETSSPTLDYSENNNQGIWQGTLSSISGIQKIQGNWGTGDAISFDRSGQEQIYTDKSIGLSSNSNNDNLSFSLWFKPSNIPQVSGSGSPTLIGGFDNDNSFGRVAMEDADSDGNGSIIFRTSGGNSGQIYDKIQAGNWYHIIATWEEGRGHDIWINGSYVGSGSNLDTSPAVVNWSIADKPNDGANTHGFPGVIDEVHAYDMIINSSENVSNLYNYNDLDYNISPSVSISNLSPDNNTTVDLENSENFTVSWTTSATASNLSYTVLESNVTGTWDTTLNKSLSGSTASVSYDFNLSNVNEIKYRISSLNDAGNSTVTSNRSVRVTNILDDWYRPTDQSIFTSEYGNNHDIVLYKNLSREYPYYAVISGNGNGTDLWKSKEFSYSSSTWTLVNDDYDIDGYYEYDDGTQVNGTFYIFEQGDVFTCDTGIESCDGSWTKSGTFPTSDIDDIGVYYDHENKVFRAFGENGDFPDGPDGTQLAHMKSDTGLGNWVMVDQNEVDPNPDGGDTYGVGDATMLSVNGTIHVLYDRETATENYDIYLATSDSWEGDYNRRGVVMEARTDQTDDWDNYRIQDADFEYIPSLGRFAAMINWMDTDGDPGSFTGQTNLDDGDSRVIGSFYSNYSVAPTDTPDTTPPSSSDNLTESGFVDKSEVDVDLTATDDDSGVANISYQVNGGSYTTVSGSSTVVNINEQGNNTLEYYATDNAGNVESTNTEYVALNFVEPNIDLNEPEDGAKYAYPDYESDVSIDFNWEIEAGTDDGNTTLYINSNQATTENFNKFDNSTFSYSESLSAGEYTYYVEAETDNFAKQSETRSFTVDQTSETRPELTLDIPGNNAVYQFGPLESQAEVEFQYSIDAGSENGTSKIYLNNSLVNSEPFSIRTTDTYTYRQNLSAGNYEYFVEADTPLYNVESFTRSFTVEQKPMNRPVFNLSNPENGSSIVTENETNYTVGFAGSVEAETNGTVDLELDRPGVNGFTSIANFTVEAGNKSLFNISENFTGIDFPIENPSFNASRQYEWRLSFDSTDVNQSFDSDFSRFTFQDVEADATEEATVGLLEGVGAYWDAFIRNSNFVSKAFVGFMIVVSFGGIGYWLAGSTGAAISMTTTYLVATISGLFPGWLLLAIVISALAYIFMFKGGGD